MVQNKEKAWIFIEKRFKQLAGLRVVTLRIFILNLISLILVPTVSPAVVCHSFCLTLHGVNLRCDIFY